MRADKVTSITIIIKITWTHVAFYIGTRKTRVITWHKWLVFIGSLHTNMPFYTNCLLNVGALRMLRRVIINFLQAILIIVAMRTTRNCTRQHFIDLNYCYSRVYHDHQHLIITKIDKFTDTRLEFSLMICSFRFIWRSIHLDSPSFAYSLFVRNEERHF